jgi:transcriptional regulator with XRE-family HTH domain
MPSSMRSATNEDKVIGQKIRARRLAEGMSQQTLGEKLGVSFQQVQKYEKGTNRVSYSRLMQIAKALGESVTFFFVDPNPVTSKKGTELQAAMAIPEIQKLALSVMTMNPGLRRAVLSVVQAIEESK